MKNAIVLFYVFLCYVYGASVPVEKKYKVNVVDLNVIPTRNLGNRIVGGQDTNIEDWPFVVQVMRFMSPSCAGSLLTERHVLSAAHCFVNNFLEDLPADWFAVRAGSTTLFEGGIISQVIKLITHEEYSRVVIRDHDIAMLLIQDALPLGSTIALASIPQSEYVVPDDSLVTYLGWGFTSPIYWSLSVILQEVNVYKVNQELCRERYIELEEQLLEEEGRIYSYPVTDTMLCAGIMDVGGRDACQGDSGGPLVFNGVVVGVITWAHSCAHPMGMGVNARVANYTEWISDAVDRLTVQDGAESEESEEVEEESQEDSNEVDQETEEDQDSTQENLDSNEQDNVDENNGVSPIKNNAILVSILVFSILSLHNFMIT